VPTVGIVLGKLARRNNFRTLGLRGACGTGTTRCRRQPNPGIATLAGRRHFMAPEPTAADGTRRWSVAGRGQSGSTERQHLSAQALRHAEREWTEWPADGSGSRQEQALRIYFVNFLDRTDWHRRPFSTVVDEKGRTIPLAALEQLRLRIRTRHYSYRTECTYVDWARRFFDYLVDQQGGPQPQVHAEAVRDYLTHLAVHKRVSASTQNQAMCAILFLCREVLALNPEALSLTLGDGGARREGDVRRGDDDAVPAHLGPRSGHAQVADAATRRQHPAGEPQGAGLEGDDLVVWIRKGATAQRALVPLDEAVGARIVA